MFADPESNISQFELKEGDQVADLGAGSAFYTVAAARKVGEKGRVHALEVQKDLLTRVKHEAEKAHLHNVDIIWANIEKLGGTKLRDRSMDAVIISNVLFQVEDKPIFALEVKRILKPTGRILLIDWSDSFGGMGPKGDALIPKDKAVALFASHGFELEKDISAGAHHYGIILKKNL